MEVGKYMGKVKTKGVSTYTIYKINFLNDDYVYIGSTNNFRQRINEHISDCHNPKKTHYNYPVYKHIRKLESKGEFKFDERCFEIIEVIDDCDEEIIKFYERGWIEFYKEEKIEMLNSIRPIQTKEELREQMKKGNKKYYEANKDEINRKRREKYAEKKAQAEQK